MNFVCQTRAGKGDGSYEINYVKQIHAGERRPQAGKQKQGRNGRKASSSVIIEKRCMIS